MRDRRFTFLCNEEERLLITALAEKLQRSQSDAVRFIVIKTTKELGIPKENKEKNSSEGLRGYCNE